MSDQQTLISGKAKRRGPAPTGQGTPVLVRLHPADLDDIDAWIEVQPDQPSRPEAVRRLIRKGLAST